MKNKGFTLIELLAVIVILAILALIVSPIISGVITNAKLSAAARSLEGYVQSIELAEIKYQTANQGSVTKDLNDLSIEARNKNKVTINSIVIEDSGIVSSINATVDGYTCTYSKDSGAECIKENDNPLVALPYTIKNSFNHAELIKQIEKTLEGYNVTLACYNGDVDCPELGDETRNLIDDEVAQLYVEYSSKLYDLINRDNVLSIDFYNDGRVINDAEVLDASEAQDNSVKMYYKVNYENPEGYDVSFVADHHDIVFPADSSFFFSELDSLNVLSFNNAIDTRNITNMESMFEFTGYSSTKFILDLGDKFDTSNVTDMSNMFNGTGYSSTVFTLDLGDKFDTSKVTNMQWMFNNTGYSSTTFKTLELGNKFDTSKVTNMDLMFFRTGFSSPLFNLELRDQFDTSNVTKMESMFADTGCTGMTSLNLGSKFVNIASSNTDMFTNTGKSTCLIYVPSDVYYSNKQLKQNNAATTAYTESLEGNRTFVQQ